MRVALTPGAGCCAIRLMPKFGGASSALTPYTSATEGATASSGCSAEPHSRSPDAAGRPEGWQAQRGAIPPTGARSRLRCGNAGPRSEIKKPRGGVREASGYGDSGSIKVGLAIRGLRRRIHTSDTQLAP
ncbi:hypothetical protein MRX96_037819 [Rhipicephalus microplus]